MRYAAARLLYGLGAPGFGGFLLLVFLGYVVCSPDGPWSAEQQQKCKDTCPNDSLEQERAYARTQVGSWQGDAAIEEYAQGHFKFDQEEKGKCLDRCAKCAAAANAHERSQLFPRCP